MALKRHAFKIGKFKCTVIADGAVEAPIEEMAGLFPAIPAAEFQPALAAAFTGRETVNRPFNLLCVQTGDRVILVDAGLGAGDQHPYGQLLPNLAEMGITPEMVDTLIISHCHGDHVNGLVDAHNTLVFPNASYLMAAPEWEHWMGPEGAARGDNFQMLYNILSQIEPRLTLVNHGHEIVPGFHLISAFGHTPGHMGMVLESDGQVFHDLVDIMHLEVQLQHPDWSPKYDHDPGAAAQTRRRLVEEAIQANALVLLYHLPYPGLGTLQPAGDGFRWDPVK